MVSRKFQGVRINLLHSVYISLRSRYIFQSFLIFQDRRVQSKIYLRNSHFPRQPMKIPYKKFKKYKEYDPFTFQNKWTPIGPPTDPNKTPKGPQTDPESERRQPKLPNDGW